MTNHVHLVVVPAAIDGLHRMLKPLHMRYAQRINRARGWKGASIAAGGAPFLLHPEEHATHVRESWIRTRLPGHRRLRRGGSTRLDRKSAVVRW